MISRLNVVSRLVSDWHKAQDLNTYCDKMYEECVQERIRANRLSVRMDAIESIIERAHSFDMEKEEAIGAIAAILNNAEKMR